MKRYLTLFVFCFLTFVFSSNVIASGFHISEIGGVDTGGQMLSQWWNTSLQPTIRGEALPGEDILISIDDNSVSIAADSSGDWVYTPASPLAEGDHSVTFSSSESTINFTLTLGRENVDWDAVGSGATDTLPTVGFFLPTLLLTGAGSGLIVLAKKKFC